MKLRNGYEKFSSWERFLLFLDASDRKDEEEQLHLLRTTPETIYRARDQEFFDKLAACREISMICHIFWLEGLAKYAISETRRVTSEQNSIDLSSLKAVRVGFERFCEGIGVEKEKWLSQAMPLATSFRLENEFGWKEIPCNEKKADSFCEDLLKLWKRRTCFD